MANEYGWKGVLVVLKNGRQTSFTIDEKNGMKSRGKFTDFYRTEPDGKRNKVRSFPTADIEELVWK